MEYKKMSERHFQSLYTLNVPRLYRAALCLTGDSERAERIAADAFLETALDRACAQDARDFASASLCRLCEMCTRTTYACKSRAAIDAGLTKWQADFLAECTAFERALIVLALLLEMSPVEISCVLKLPQWVVKLRLWGLSRVILYEEHAREEDLAVYATGPF